MKDSIRKLMYSVFSLVNKFIPKKNQVFVYGGNELSGNSETMLKYLLDNTDLSLICIADKRSSVFDLSSRISFKNNSFWNAFFSYASSKVVLESSLHTIKMKPDHGQLFLQMWHGSPLKHLPKSGTIKNGDYYSYIFYASELFKEEVRQSFDADETKMLLSGFPRNDDLFRNVKLPSSFKNNISVMWLPTFRHGIGLTETQKDIPIINKQNIQILSIHLAFLNMELYIKPHPLQIGGFSDLLLENNVENIHLLADDDLRDNNLTLYSFLGNMDALITDYSSVYFDYLLLNRPIGFAIDDFDEYQKNRGFALNPAEDYMPGPKLTSMEELLLFLDDVQSGNDNYADKRLKINNLANYYQDDRSSERCTELILKVIDTV